MSVFKLFGKCESETFWMAARCSFSKMFHKSTKSRIEIKNLRTNLEEFNSTVQLDNKMNEAYWSRLQYCRLQVLWLVDTRTARRRKERRLVGSQAWWGFNTVTAISIGITLANTRVESLNRARAEKSNREMWKVSGRRLESHWAKYKLFSLYTLDLSLNKFNGADMKIWQSARLWENIFCENFTE